MASCHARAVMLRRNEYRDETNYNVALVVAMHMGSDGRPATVSLATIAEYAHCHYNTADKRTKEMSEAGQLHMGRGGRFLTYAVPYDGDDGAPEGDKAAVSEVIELRQEVAELKEQLAQLTAVVTSLSHDLHIIVTRPSHVLHTSFTPTDENNVSKEGKRESKEEDKNPPNPPGGKSATPSRPVLVIPDSLNTPVFLAEWGEWVAYKGKRLKPKTYQGQLDKLAREPVEFAIARLELSRLNEWKGLWYSGEKPIVINGCTADGQVYRNGTGGHRPQQPAAGLPTIVVTDKGW